MLVLFFIVPLPRFDESTSTVVLASNGELLGAKISTDEQWRFSPIDSVTPKFECCITQFEDQWFRYHIGINPISLCRASYQNIKARKVVSGGSTLTMQTVRLLRKGKARSVKEKLIEIYFAFRMEMQMSKDEILKNYVSYAPFGGNTVGLEAASWRYFNRSPDNLSWAESATLAVLPNAPSLIFPGKNQALLEAKRNRLLSKLLANDCIDTMTFNLSVQEALPTKPPSVPRYSPHFLDMVARDLPGQRVSTTIDYSKQLEVRRMLNEYSTRLSANEIHNAAVLVVDNETGNILAYVGNSDYTNKHANRVDIIRSRRSTGSIIKPLLYASMLDDGELLPRMLVPDVPLFFDGFTPENYHLTYDGAIPADEALFRSLNIPFVHLLRIYGINRFHEKLKQMSFSTIDKSAGFYGLSLILGGAEVKLWDLVKVYSSMARTLEHVSNNGYVYNSSDFRDLSYVHNACEGLESKEVDVLSAGAIWHAFEAMKQVHRPDNQLGWESYASANQIAWKTGTSFGFRDAWAVGVSHKYTVGVWIGNADGEGRPGLTGVTAAAPLMFDVFGLLNPTWWFKEPYDEFVEATVCAESGCLASRHCEEIDTAYILSSGLRTSCCSYHKTIQLDKTGIYRVNSYCAEPSEMLQASWFVLPPTMAWYYKKGHPSYKELPPMMPGCSKTTHGVMEFVYPKNISKVYIPLEMDGQRGKVIFEIAHSVEDAKLYWHLDDKFIGTTFAPHQMALCPEVGTHIVSVVDGLGNSLSESIFFDK